ncbi:hypothetical protein FRB91_008315 [Serendipita sp. 411]|nr:hypothetical protein FRC15_003440 [Serendipita sp. 397]KAG8851193.1 hypothetical protein FRB91_008315 [Serendipita sp. 411]
MTSIDIPSTTAHPLAGLVGGAGIALSSSLLLYASGRVFGVSGFLHRTVSPQSLNSSPTTTKVLAQSRNRLGDAFALLGLGIGGWFIGRSSSGSATLALSGHTLVGTVAAGLLSGIGSKLAGGCTSGHMLSGVSRLSRRSIVATGILGLSSSLVVQFNQGSLPVVVGHAWVLNRFEKYLATSILIVLSGSVALLKVSQIRPLRNNTRYLSAVYALVHLLSGIGFGISLGLSGVVSATRVQGFLVTPFRHPELFDSTLGFFGLGAIPLASGLYHLAVKLRNESQRAEKTTQATPANDNQAVYNERDPLFTSDSSSSCSVPYLASKDTWPARGGEIDRRLVLGSILFGAGWGLRGICPGPAVVNLGTSLYGVFTSGRLLDSSYWTVWLLAFLAGGKIVPK